MYTCMTCCFSNWQKTKNGRLHPSGDGRCMWKLPEIALPIAYSYPGNMDRKSVPSPSGGYINRKTLRPCSAWKKL